MATVKSSILRGLSMLLALIAAMIAVRYWRHHSLYLVPDDAIAVGVVTVIVGLGIVIDVKRRRQRRSV